MKTGTHSLPLLLLLLALFGLRLPLRLLWLGPLLVLVLSPGALLLPALWGRCRVQSLKGNNKKANRERGSSWYFFFLCSTLGNKFWDTEEDWRKRKSKFKQNCNMTEIKNKSKERKRERKRNLTAQHFICRFAAITCVPFCGYLMTLLTLMIQMMWPSRHGKFWL